MARYEQLAVNELTVEAPLRLETYTVAELPAPGDWKDAMVIVSNGAAGAPILAFSDGVNWLRSDTGAPVAII